MKNFIQIDNTEEEQVEQIKKWWNSNGKQIIAGAVISGVGLITDITFLIIIGGVCLFGSMYGKYFR